MKKRIGILLLSFIVIYISNFYISRLMPGDPFSHSESSSGSEMEGLSEEDLERMKAYYGLDKPIHEQFKNTLKDNIKGDFGESILYKKTVMEVIMTRLPWTVFIMMSTLLLSLLIGVLLALLGIYNPRLGKIAYSGLTFIAEIPSFIVGILLLFLLAAKIHWIPLSGNITPFYQYGSRMEYIRDVIRHGLMPIMTLVIINIPSFYFTSVSSFRSVLDKQYIINAESKGLKRRTIGMKYILLNSIFPIIARFFLSVGSAIGASMVVENIFSYPELGTVLRDAVIYRDFILIQGIFLISTTTVLISSFISDCITGFIGKRNI